MDEGGSARIKGVAKRSTEGGIGLQLWREIYGLDADGRLSVGRGFIQYCVS
jgi:hypothetical protein